MLLGATLLKPRSRCIGGLSALGVTSGLGLVRVAMAKSSYCFRTCLEVPREARSSRRRNLRQMTTRLAALCLRLRRPRCRRRCRARARGAPRRSARGCRTPPPPPSRACRCFSAAGAGGCRPRDQVGGGVHQGRGVRGLCGAGRQDGANPSCFFDSARRRRRRASPTRRASRASRAWATAAASSCARRSASRALARRSSTTGSAARSRTRSASRRA